MSNVIASFAGKWPDLSGNIIIKILEKTSDKKTIERAMDFTKLVVNNDPSKAYDLVIKILEKTSDEQTVAWAINLVKSFADKHLLVACNLARKNS